MGETMDQVLLNEAVELARKLWRAYVHRAFGRGRPVHPRLLGSTELLAHRHGQARVYLNLEAFFAGLERDQEEAQGITFEILDEYYEARALGEDTCFVFGTLWVRERPTSRSRCSWKWTRVSAGIPSRGRPLAPRASAPLHAQRRPAARRVLSENGYRAGERRARVLQVLERRAELDSMTELFNHAPSRTMWQRRWSKAARAARSS